MPPAKKRRVAAATAAAIADEANGDDFTSNKNSAHMNKLLQQHRESLDTLLHIVAELSSGTNNNNKLSESVLSSSLALTNLKSLQRQIALQVEAQANESKEQRSKVEECSLMLENLTYERNYLQREIGSLEGWKADELEKMAWAELGMDDPSLKNNNESISSEDVVMGDDTDITTSEAAINAYLFGKSDSNNDHRDPKNHAAILQKLQADLETRSSLVDELSQSKLKLKELQKKRDELREFLNNQIPKKLGELEKGAESLNNFFGSHNVWNEALKVGGKNDGMDDDDDDVKKEKKYTANMLVNRPSFDRSKRFQLAKSNLPPPLYVLYVQLVGYRDAWASLEKVGECDGNKPNALGGFVGADGMDVNVDNTNESEWRVILTLSTSDILPAEVTSTFGGRTASSNSRSSSPTPGPNSLSIVFSYDKEDGVVYALADLDGNEDLGEELLDNLFPEDDGSTLPNVSLSLLNQEEEEDESDENEGESSSDMMETTDSTKPEKKKKNGKAFYWCQILSDLNFAPPTSSWDTNVVTDTAGDDTPFDIQICTKAVMRQLLRRIRARQSLACMVDFLGRRGQFGIPIHPAMKSDNASNTPTPKAKLQSFAKEEEMKVYVATIKRKSSTLKATVTISNNYPAEPSVWTLQNEDGSSGSVPSSQSNGNNNDALFDPNLTRIECHVNQDLEKFVCQDVEATYDWILTHQLADIVSCWDELMSAKEEGNTNKMNGDGRLRKGKDRRLIGFGEKSPFFWYRKGL